MPEIVALEKVKKGIIEEFPDDAIKISKLFEKKDFLNILNFLETKNSFNNIIIPEIVLGAINQGKIDELKKCAEKLIAKKERIEKLFEICAWLWARQIKMYHS